MGVKECLEHGLLVPYPVMSEKTGESVAHFKATVMIGGACTSVLSGLTLQGVSSTKKVEDKDLVALLALSMDKEDQKKQRKAAKKAAVKA